MIQNGRNENDVQSRFAFLGRIFAPYGVLSGYHRGKRLEKPRLRLIIAGTFRTLNQLVKVRILDPQFLDVELDEGMQSGLLDVVGKTDPFLQQVAAGTVELYNEFSLQHEIGIALRKELGNSFRVQFERPTQYFRITKKLVKREIDIAIFTPDFRECHAIELKYPINGQHPEQMFQFCKDIVFLEELVRYGPMQSGLLLILADDPLFYERGSTEGIYAPFRAGKKLNGRIQNQPASEIR